MRTGSVPDQRGFAYLLLLLAVALIGVAASAAVTLGAAMARRDAEQQLLAIGVEFQQALRSYAGVPVGAVMPTGGRGPRSLEDLLKDPTRAGDSAAPPEALRRPFDWQERVGRRD